ncbi:MAG TPA: CehA/McbA family metallohydrolase [Bacillota bacterium]|nr:CehA/McbA family metallohydrolase [Bacillota bacterium]
MSLNSLPRTTPTTGRWIVADLHVHSTYSGGSLTPAELVKNAQMHLFDAIAITDHNQIVGAIEAKQIANTVQTGAAIFNGAANDLEIIISQEISLGDHFHLLVLGAQEAWTGANRSKLVEKIHQSHDAGAVIILAHPWTLPKSSWAFGCLEDLLAGNLVDGVELFNASILESQEQGAKTLTSIWENLIVPHHLAVTGGSDFHYYKQGRQLGAGRTYLKVSGKGGTGIMEALRNRRTVAGLFNYRPFDLGQFGTGNGTIWGRDPWYSELRELGAVLNLQINNSMVLNPTRQTALIRLMGAGHYQMVQDLM